MIKFRHFFRFRDLLGILGIYILITAILSAERAGIKTDGNNTPSVAPLAAEKTMTAAEVSAGLPKDCLVLADSENADSAAALTEFRQILLDMKIGYDMADLAVEAMPDPAPYSTCIVLISSFDRIGEDILTLTDWVREGGRALFALTPGKDTYFNLVSQKLGVLNAGDNQVTAESFVPDPDFMIGGGEVYPIPDAFDSSLAVQLDEQTVVYAETEKNHVPLVWSREYGEGRFVVDNIGIYEKADRGIFAASVSLLEDVCVWPVLDGAVFYLDDFPSPVPGGNGEYIWRDYAMTTSDFYVNVWWPDTLSIAEKHGIRYTGVIIENYGDDTESEPERQKDTARFQYFGNMLLHLGGELGYHGYNHQPLCLDGTDYGDVLPYNTWRDHKSMKEAVKELIAFADEMFPTAERSVYVPPSNVISEDGLSVLAEIPEIRTVASTYFPGDFAYTQEFGVQEDGTVEQPRFVSGAMMGDYERLVALSELNMHYVFNHFIHPDDLLDEDRGAALGWEKLKGNLTWMFDWLFKAAPSIRRLTGSELSAEIQRYSKAVVKKEVSGNHLALEIGNFEDRCLLFLRLNGQTPGDVKGGTLEPLTGSLYLLTADSETVDITLEGEPK